MPESKALRHLKAKLKKLDRRLKTADELRASGVTGTGNPSVSTLYTVPKKQYEQDPLPDGVSALSGYALWHKHEGLDRFWAVKFMNTLPDALDWQFVGVTTGKRKVDNVTAPIMTARFVYKSLDFKLAITWVLAPLDEKVGLRYTQANGETGARWCDPAEIVDVVLTLINADYDRTNPNHPRRSWLP